MWFALYTEYFGQLYEIIHTLYMSLIKTHDFHDKIVRLFKY